MNSPTGHRFTAALMALAGAVVVITALLFSGISLSQFDTANLIWKVQVERANAVNAALAELNRQIGYGGFIHNLKNLIVSRDLQIYRNTIDRNVAGFRQALNRLDRLLRAPQDRAAVAELHRTFENYARKYRSVLAMAAAGATAKTLDAALAVDDGAALKALAYLNARADAQALEARNMVRATFLDAIRLSWIGGMLLVLVILAAAVILTRYVRHFSAVNAALQKAQKNLDTLIDTAPDSILTVMQDGRIVRANHMAEHFFGYPAGALVGMKIEQLIPDRYRHVHRDHRQHYFTNPQSYKMNSRFDLVALTRDGGEPDVEISQSSSGEGADWLATVIVRDVTERKRLERKALEQFKLTEAFFSYSVSCLVILDRNFNYLRVNAAYAQACRRNISEFTGRNHFDMLPTDNKMIFEEAIRTRKPIAISEKALVFADQPERGITYWDYSLAPVLDKQGEVEFLVFSLNEVTGHKRAMEALELSMKRVQALSERVLTVEQSERDSIARELHDELGQTLTALKINLQMLEPFCAAREAESYLTEALMITSQALEQVRSMMVDLRPPGLEELGLAVVLKSHLAKRMEACGWDAHCEILLPERLRPELEMVCFRVVQEALTNVMRHAQAKRIWLTLVLDAGEVRLNVRDDGKGFFAAAVSDASSTPTFGLIGMQERVRLMGGRLTIDSAPGRGAEVRASFPFEPAGRKADAGASART